jgi:hypothetical protein
MKRAQSSQGPVPQNETLETSRRTKARSSKTAGIVKKIVLENFLCHDRLKVDFNEQINFIIGNY